MQMAEDWRDYWRKSEETEYGGVIFWIRTEDETTAGEHLPINMDLNDAIILLSKLSKFNSRITDSNLTASAEISNDLI